MPNSAAEQFLADFEGQEVAWLRPPGTPASLATDRVLLGKGEHMLQVAIATSGGEPKAEDLRTLFRLRLGNRPSPVLLVVLYEVSNGSGTTTLKASAIGTTGTPTPVMGLEAARLERVCRAALAEPDRHSAARTIDRQLVSLKDSQFPGLDNSGLFASHELHTGVPARADWEEKKQLALPLLGKRGMDLISALGYQTANKGSAALVLTHGGNSRAIAILLDESEVFDRPSPRFGVGANNGGTSVTPVTHGLTLAKRDELGWLIVLRGAQIRLYPASPDVGVGRKGQGETYAELDLALLAPTEAAYLTLFFAPQALARGGTVDQIIASSENFAADLGKRLRNRVYEDVVPALALAIASRMDARTEDDLAEAYHRTLLALFRLLFLAYAEDRKLLPYGRNPHYDRHAIKSLARDFAAKDDSQVKPFDENGTSYWDGILSIWEAIDQGNADWDVPAYNGGLFSCVPEISSGGAALASMPNLTDAEFGPVLRAMLIDTGEDGTQGPVDFRSLGVREFGTIYEGLLESELSITPVDLKVDSKTKAYVPAKPGDTTMVSAGSIYIHNKSGERKATGSYFTKQFAVEHLLDSALESSLTDHLARVAALLETGDTQQAADAFFDFRVADPAMGSAHFLVAAVDRIEARFTTFLAEHRIPAVADELSRLEHAAREALGDQSANVDIETGALLRRQIARRCVYGLDVNVIAVELARVSIWIHTFVPGLPMSSLDHNLVVGNSLTGIGTIDEVLDVLEPRRAPGQASFFADEIGAALLKARGHLLRAAKTAEATKAEVKDAARAHSDALRDAADAKALMDAAVAIRLGVITLDQALEPAQAIIAGRGVAIQEKLTKLGVTHLPYLFPEVFLRDNGGFDCMLGNPPWEKVKVEEHQWWGLRFPGLRSMPQKAKNAAIASYRRERPELVAEYEEEVTRAEAVKTALGSGDFPGLRAATDTDLSIAFAWRFWKLLRENGRSAVVLPRGVLAGRAGAQWRAKILNSGAFLDVTNLVNSGNWVFDMEPRYTIGLVSIAKGSSHVGSVGMHGPYFSLGEYKTGVLQPPQQLPAKEFAGWADGAPFPLFPHADSLDVFVKLRAHPRLDAVGGDWEFVPLRELHATDNKEMLDFDLAHPHGDFPVLTGASFNLWDPDYGAPYAYAKSTKVIPWLQERRRRSVRLSTSAFYKMPTQWASEQDTLPCLHSRIAFREIARATDSRTVICCLVPPNRLLVHKAPYLLQRRGDAVDEAYLLGILSSISLDWYSRRYVELNMAYGLLSSFPVPRSTPGDPRRKRVAEIAGRLAAVDSRYAAWAAEVGVPVGSVTTREIKDDLVAELDAAVALLYGLSRADIEHIFATFHRGWEYQTRLAAVHGHFDRWVASQKETEVA